MKAWVLALIINILNLFDALVTYEVVIARRIAFELNPFMDLLLHQGAWWFFSVKLLLGAGGALLLWHFRERKSARIGLWILTIAYSLVALSHIVQAWLFYRA